MDNAGSRGSICHRELPLCCCRRTGRENNCTSTDGGIEEDPSGSELGNKYYDA